MRCSVVFGVTLRLLVINTSSSSPTINTAAYYQRCVITCETMALVHRRPCWQHLACCTAALTAGTKARYKLRIAIATYLTCIRRPVRGVPVGILLCSLAWKNENGVATRWWKKIADTFIRFDTTHERDRHTDTHTDRQTLHDCIGRAYA